MNSRAFFQAFLEKNKWEAEQMIMAGYPGRVAVTMENIAYLCYCEGKGISIEQAQADNEAWLKEETLILQNQIATGTVETGSPLEMEQVIQFISKLIQETNPEGGTKH